MAEKMVRYQAVRRCTFNDYYFESGDIAEFPDNVKVDHPFLKKVEDVKKTATSEQK